MRAGRRDKSRRHLVTHSARTVLLKRWASKNWVYLDTVSATGKMHSKYPLRDSSDSYSVMMATSSGVKSRSLVPARARTFRRVERKDDDAPRRRPNKRSVLARSFSLSYLEESYGTTPTQWKASVMRVFLMDLSMGDEEDREGDTFTSSTQAFKYLSMRMSKPNTSKHGLPPPETCLFLPPAQPATMNARRTHTHTHTPKAKGSRNGHGSEKRVSHPQCTAQT